VSFAGSLRPTVVTTSAEGNLMQIDKQFQAQLQKSPAKGGWTYVVMPTPPRSSEPAGW
jgi:hypothetical protein